MSSKTPLAIPARSQSRSTARCKMLNHPPDGRDLRRIARHELESRIPPPVPTTEGINSPIDRDIGKQVDDAVAVCPVAISGPDDERVLDRIVILLAPWNAT